MNNSPSVPASSEYCWAISEHACKHCTGRLLRRVNTDGSLVHRCAECGASAQGEHDTLCCCGIEVRGHGTVFECFRNPNVSMAAPQEILVRERPMVKAPERTPGRVSNPVRVEGY